LCRASSSIAALCRSSNSLFCRSYYNKIKQPILSLEKIKVITVSFGGLTEGSVGTREFASQISGKKVKQSNPKAVVDVEIDNELVHPKVNVEFINGQKSCIDTTNLSFKKILHTVQDEIRAIELEMDKDNWDKFRQQQQTYILSGIKEWEEKHKQMIKELNQKK
ncbi:hypothetical protein WA171_006289, partial [Blastocystis sp. BT1]